MMGWKQALWGTTKGLETLKENADVDVLTWVFVLGQNFVSFMLLPGGKEGLEQVTPTYEGLSNLPKRMELENVRANFRSAFAKFQYAGSLHCSILSSCWCSYLGFSVIQASFWIFVAFRGHRDKVSHPWSPIDPRHKIQGQLTSTPAELVKVYSFALGVNPQLWSMLPLLLVALYFNITGIKHRKKYRLMVNFWKTRYILDTIWHFNVCKCAKPARLLCPWNSSGKNTGVGYCALFHGIFLTQGSNLHLLHLLR